MDTIVEVSSDKFFTYRSDKNLEFYSRADKGVAELFLQASNGIVMRTSIDQEYPNYFEIIAQSNKHIPIESLMIETHNFGKNNTWADQNNSAYTLQPYSGYKLIITSIVTRFPDTVNLTSNPISFTVYKYVPQYDATIPVISETYTSITSLLTKSNSPWYSVEFLNNAFTTKMIEVKFRYADSDENNSSKLTLLSSRNEKIVVNLNTHTPLLNTNGQALDDPCYAIFNTKRVLDF